MRQFLQHHGEQILGVLNGFDRAWRSEEWIGRGALDIGDGHLIRVAPLS